MLGNVSQALVHTQQLSATMFFYESRTRLFFSYLDLLCQEVFLFFSNVIIMHRVAPVFLVFWLEYSSVPMDLCVSSDLLPGMCTL